MRLGLGRGCCCCFCFEPQAGAYGATVFAPSSSTSPASCFRQVVGWGWLTRFNPQHAGWLAPLEARGPGTPLTTHVAHGSARLPVWACVGRGHLPAAALARPACPQCALISRRAPWSATCACADPRACPPSACRSRFARGPRAKARTPSTGWSCGEGGAGAGGSVWGPGIGTHGPRHMRPLLGTRTHVPFSCARTVLKRGGAERAHCGGGGGSMGSDRVRRKIHHGEPAPPKGQGAPPPISSRTARLPTPMCVHHHPTSVPSHPPAPACAAQLDASLSVPRSPPHAHARVQDSQAPDRSARARVRGQGDHQHQACGRRQRVLILGRGCLYWL